MFRVTSPTRMSDQQLSRLVKRLGLLLVLGTVAFAVFYYFDRHPLPGPSLIDRQITRAEELVRQDPSSITSRNVLAADYAAAKRFGDAAEQFRQVLSVAPHDTIALLGRGSALLALADLDGARASYQQVVDDMRGQEFANIDPSLEEARYWLGTIYAQQHLVTRASLEFALAVRIERTDSDAWYGLGRARLDLGDAVGAVEPLRQATLFVPTDWPQPYQALAEAYARLGRPEPQAWAQAMALFAQGKPETARGALEKLAATAPSAEVLLGLGLVTESLGDRPAAAKWYAAAVGKDPTSFSAQQGLARTTDTPTPRPPTPGPATQPPTPTLPPVDGAANGRKS
jgi:tetratricopeptide (TPR) repeat protein